MAQTRLTSPGVIVQKGTNLTRPELGHLISGPYVAGAGCLSGGFVKITITGGAVTVCATTEAADGFIVHKESYNWGTTVPKLGATIPTGIDVLVCEYGCGIVPCDVSEIVDGAKKHSPVYPGATSGLAGCAGRVNAAGPNGTTVAEVVCGMCMDVRAGNSGSGTGGADLDPMEIFFGAGEALGEITT
jgi:hypothetical protein